jgi:predicted transcriptional regulator
MSLFRAGDQNVEALRTEISFIHDIQLEIETAMEEQGISQADLAKLLNVSEARVSQMLSDNGANFEGRTIARVARVMGCVARVKFEPAHSAASNGAARVSCLKHFARVKAENNSQSRWARYAASNDQGWIEYDHHPREMAAV